MHLEMLAKYVGNVINVWSDPVGGKTAHYVCIESIIKSEPCGEPEYHRISGKYFVFKISPHKVGLCCVYRRDHIAGGVFV